MTKHRSAHLCIVVKIGTSSIVDERTHEPILPILSFIVDTVIRLKRDGHKVVIVSSGAIGVGLQRMQITKKPKHLPQTQALAAIGQCRLIAIWDSLFAHYGQPVAQILLTRNDIADRSQYLNAQNTLAEVLNYGVIPIVNENDTLAVSEIRFGDNDTLSAITAAMVHADYLFLMTDVEALYDKNPRTNPDAQPIRTVADIDSLTVDVSSRGSDLGTGGMATKLIAARLATSAGTTTIITTSSKPGNVRDIISHFHPRAASSDRLAGDGQISPSSSQILEKPPLHTRFLPSATPIRNRAFWILHGLVPQGTIYVDRGAAAALQNRAGLLPVGIVEAVGSFGQNEAVRIVVVDRATPVSSTHESKPSTADPPHTETPSPSSTPSRSISRSTSSATVPNTTASLSPACTGTGEEIGRALVNYSADQVQRIKGLRSFEISRILGYADSEYVAFRENVSLHAAHNSGSSTPRPRSVNMSGSGLLEQVLTPSGSTTSAVNGGEGGSGGEGGGGLESPAAEGSVTPLGQDIQAATPNPSAP